MKLDNTYSLILVGTGFASAFFLKRYLEANLKHTKVLVLEQGKIFPYKNRLQAKKGKATAEYEKIKKNTDCYIGTDSSKPWVFDPNFGGSSNCWTGCTPRLMPNDFRLNTNYGIAQDWPIAYNELEHYYSQAEATMLIAGPELTPFPKSKPYVLPPHQLSTVDLRMQKQYKELYISQPTARASATNSNRGVCCSSSVCDVCPANAKCTVENTFAAIFEDSRVHLVTESEVQQILVQNNLAKGVLVKNNGKEIEYYADMVVLAANAIGNAAILLRSNDPNPLTGKGICEQAGKYITAYLADLENVGGSSIITANGYMMYDGQHRKDRAACLIESFNLPLLIRNEHNKWRKIARFKFVYEDLPQPLNFVSIDKATQKPKITFSKPSTYLLKSVENLKSDFEKYFSFLNLDKYEIDEDLQKSEYHIYSTTPMSDDKDKGVVNKFQVHHHWSNVVLLGSSVFTTISPANPTLTISALSIRAAEHQLGII